MPAEGLPELAATVDDRLDEYVADLFDLLAQPSVSATGEGIDDCAGLVGALMRAVGLETRTIGTSRHPIVRGERHVDDALPTVVFYGHYDVQPPGDDDPWESQPFDPERRDGAIYARGAGDNKGQFVTHLFAVDALLAVDGELPCNVGLLVEGGEESGSHGFVEHLRDDPAGLAAADLVYVADGPMHRSRRPTLVYGNRGMLSLQLDLERATTDHHSGNFGGPTPNAANELIEALATAFDGNAPAIDGFYDGVAITEADRDLVADVPTDGAAIRETLGIDTFATDEPYYERLLLEPTFSVNGLRSGYGGDGMKTIIPHRATAKVDVRLVPDQSPDATCRRIREHFERVNPAIDVTRHGSFPPTKTPLDTPAADAVLAALEAAWGIDPVEMPLLGGSLPAGYIREELDVPVLIVPYANPDQGNHSPNEHLDVDCFRNGILASAAFLRRVPGALGDRSG